MAFKTNLNHYQLSVASSAAAAAALTQHHRYFVSPYYVIDDTSSGRGIQMIFGLWNYSMKDSPLEKES